MGDLNNLVIFISNNKNNTNNANKSLDFFKSTIKKDADAVNKEIKEFFAQKKICIKPFLSDVLNVEELENIEDYISGGKRLRPAAMIEAYKAVGGKDLQAITKATLCIEFLHNSALVHDDIIDRSMFRHSKPTMHVRHAKFYEKNSLAKHRGKELYGDSMAILDGNLLIVWALDTLNNSGFDNHLIQKSINVWREAYELIVYGQMKDIRFEEMKKNIGNVEYVDMIELKSAMLFDAAIRIGAIFGGGSRQQIDGFRKYAIPMACGFQIQDDIIGTFGKLAETGKSNNDDIRFGKKTWFVNYAYEKLRDDENIEKRKILDSCMGNKNASDDDCDKARQVLAEIGALECAKTETKRFAETAKKNLNKIPGISKEAARFFSGYADFVIMRMA